MSLPQDLLDAARAVLGPDGWVGEPEQLRTA
jgi:hypothetical protein